MRHEINDNFRKNKMLTDPEKINEVGKNSIFLKMKISVIDKN